MSQAPSLPAGSQSIGSKSEARIRHALVAALIGEMKQVYTLADQNDIYMFAYAEIFLFDRSCCDYRVLLHDARVRVP